MNIERRILIKIILKIILFLSFQLSIKTSFKFICFLFILCMYYQTFKSNYCTDKSLYKHFIKAEAAVACIGLIAYINSFK